jgi:beta-glucosidase
LGVAINRQDFFNNALTQYVPAVRDHDVATVMPSYSSVDWTEDGVGNPIKMHANQELIAGTLKHDMGFDGFVISDWEGIHQLPRAWPPCTPERRYRDVHGAALGPELRADATDEVNAGRVSKSASTTPCAGS